MPLPVRLSDPQALVGFAEQVFRAFEPAWDQASGMCERVVGGCRFRIRSDLAGLLEIAGTAIADHPPAAHEGARLMIALGGSLGLPEVPVWGGRYYNDVAMDSALQASRYRVHHYPERDFWQVYDRETARGVQLLAAPDRLPDWDSGSPLRNFLKWRLTAENSGLVHAGSLAVGGRGLLFFGPGGSGKSGTVLAGIAAGLQSVGDDYVLVRTGERVVAEPLFRTLKSDPAGLARVGLDQRPFAGRPLNWQGKHQFTFADLGAAAVPDRLEIFALCLPVIAGADHSRFEPLSGKAAFLALAPTGISQIPGDRAANFAFCAALARRLPAFRLHLGTRPAEIAGTIARFITSGGAAC